MTTGSTDTLTGTDADETLYGVNSSSMATGTMQVTDTIDGGAGTDTMKIDMYKDWTPFTTGSMTGVENIELTNKSTSALTFDANKAEGITSYTIDSTSDTISLSNMDTLADLDITGPSTADSTFSAVYKAASTVATGTQTDTQNLTVTNVGSINTAAAGLTSNANVMSVTIPNVEALALTTAGTANTLNLSAVNSATSITVTGEGQTEIQAVGAATTSFDASAATGNVIAKLSNAADGALTTVKTGAGDDIATVVLDDLTTSATVDMGAGEDRLDVTAAAGKVVQGNFDGVETVRFTTAAGVTGNTTFSGIHVNNLETVEFIGGTLGANVDLVSMGTQDLTINAIGDGATNGLKGSTVTSDNTGAVTVNLSAGAAATTTADTSTTALTFASASALTMNLAELTVYGSAGTEVVNYGGTGAATLNVASKIVNAQETTKFNAVLTAETASKVTVDANGGFTGSVNAAKATEVTLNAGETLAATAVLGTEKATTLNLDAGVKGLTIQANSDLTKVQDANISNTGYINMIDAAASLDAIATLDVIGSGSLSKATFEDLGNTDQTYSMNITASGQKLGFTTAAINAGSGAVSLNVSGVTGDAETTTIDGDAGITIDAGNLAGKLDTKDITSAKGNVIIDVENAAKQVTVNGKVEATLGDVTLTATNAVGNVTVNSTITGNNVTIDATNALGLVKIHNGATTGTDITAKTSVTYNGANLSSSTNASDIEASDSSTALAVTLNGGASADTHTVTGNTKQSSITVDGNVGAGTDTLAVTLVDNADAAAGSTAAQTVDISAFTGDTTHTTTTTDLSADADSALTFKGSNVDDSIIFTAATSAYSNDQAISITDTTTTDTDTLKLSDGDTPKDVTLSNLTLSGIEKITVTGTAVADHVVTINASAISGQEINISGSAASQVLNLSASDDANVIDLGNIKTTTAIALTTTAGKGDDTIVLESNEAIIDTIVFEDTAANNGSDTISNFTAGAGKDVLDFSAFNANTVDTEADSAAGDSLNVSIDNSLDYSSNAVNVIALNDIQSLTADNFGGTASTTVIGTAASSSYFVTADDTNDKDGISNIYYVTTDSNNAATVTLVGTVDAAVADLDDTNFYGA